MQWTWLTDEAGWLDILAQSEQRAVLLFKHSHRCSLSSIAKHRLDTYQAYPAMSGWIIDVIHQRPLAQLITRELDVVHASPQALILRNRECIWEEDHLDIQAEEIGVLLQSPSPA